MIGQKNSFFVLVRFITVELLQYGHFPFPKPEHGVQQGDIKTHCPQDLLRNKGGLVSKAGARVSGALGKHFILRPLPPPVKSPICNITF